MKEAHARGYATVLDMGCGTGRAALYMLLKDLDVILLDIAQNAIDENLKAELSGRFVQAPLWDMPFPSDWFDVVFSCDVLEHIPTDMVDDSLAEMARVAPAAYVEWADFPDGTGPATIGEPAHLTLKPLDWWRVRFRRVYSKVEVGTRGNDRAMQAGYRHRPRKIGGGWAWLER